MTLSEFISSREEKEADLAEALLNNWRAINGGDSIGLEKEFLLVDSKGRPLKQRRVTELEDIMREEIEGSRWSGSSYGIDINLVNPNKHFQEMSTGVCNDIDMLAQNYFWLYNTLSSHLGRGESILETGSYKGRYMATHIHLGARSLKEAFFIGQASRQHLPEFIAFFNYSTRFSHFNRKMPRPFDSERLFSFARTKEQRTDYDLVLTGLSTVELRCCDSQANPDLDLAIAAYAFAVHQLARKAFAEGADYPLQRSETSLRQMYNAVKKKGMFSYAADFFITEWVAESLQHLNLNPKYGKPILEIFN
ncbi:hypothetical protein COY27_00590 [Candidatus Woesearchaeota archaeon CG_4_10_14_0_2_um_filter_33_13]|nr:MAG: hypothetical protein COY27_00590 [Candidatus Woesearchaeota archaeon CG_4_10_14_0_2_um_filter_33_13]